MSALTRRTLLGAAVAVLVAACSRNDGAPDTTSPGLGKIAYGDGPDQYGVLGMPAATASTPRGLVVLLHGGFWLSSYGAALMDPIAADLRSRGYATWNLEYRRVDGGGGFPATFEDVAAGIDHVAKLGVKAPVTVIGHSAGGHLAVWAASRSDRTPGGAPVVVADTTISLSGVLDLRAGLEENLGNGAVQGLMGDLPSGEYTYADPVQLVPAHGSVAAVHALEDRNVPLVQSRTYVDADLAAGGAAALVTVPGDHFALIDPASDAWKTILQQLP